MNERRNRSYNQAVKLVRTIIALVALAACSHSERSGGMRANSALEGLDFDTKERPCLGRAAAPECAEMTQQGLYRGRWLVGFETSFFAPTGVEFCGQTSRGSGGCIFLTGDVLPWPGRWDCSRIYELEFVGRRNVLPGLYGGYSAYKIVAERLISAKRLRDPDDPNCRPPTDAELRVDHPGIRDNCLELARRFEELPEDCFDRPKGGTWDPSMS